MFNIHRLECQCYGTFEDKNVKEISYLEYSKATDLELTPFFLEEHNFRNLRNTMRINQHFSAISTKTSSHLLVEIF